MAANWSNLLNEPILTDEERTEVDSWFAEVHAAGCSSFKLKLYKETWSSGEKIVFSLIYDGFGGREIFREKKYNIRRNGPIQFNHSLGRIETYAKAHGCKTKMSRHRSISYGTTKTSLKISLRHH